MFCKAALYDLFVEGGASNGNLRRERRLKDVRPIGAFGRGWTGVSKIQTRIGTAGWSIPRAVAQRFPNRSSVLTHYAAVFDAVEINTSFYRPHRPETYARWRESTPPSFKFAVKAPRAITHAARLEDCGALLDGFLEPVLSLGAKLGPVLVQLPPSLVFDPSIAAPFFERFRQGFDGQIVCEPRHASWFGADASALLQRLHVGRAAVDPAPHPAAAAPGGWPGLVYWRLHGSPRMYYSSYDATQLSALEQRLRYAPEAWCIFDNTAAGAAAQNALSLRAMMREVEQ